MELRESKKGARTSEWLEGLSLELLGDERESEATKWMKVANIRYMTPVEFVGGGFVMFGALGSVSNPDGLIHSRFPEVVRKTG